MYKAYKMDNYNLYMMKTDKFKTISMSIRFRKKKTKEDGVYAFILKDVLKSGTNGYEKLNEYYKAKLNIYYPTTNFQIVNYGKERTFAISTKIVNEKYTEKGMNEKGIKFVFDTLYNPKIKDLAFDKETFEICRHDYIEMLKAAKDDSFKYMTDRLWEEVNVYDFKLLSNEEAIKVAKSMTEKDLYNYYQSLFIDNSLDIFIVGDFDFEEMKNIIARIVKGNFKQNKNTSVITFDTTKNKPKEIIETVRTSQSQLGLGLKFINLTDFERKYVSVFYSSILGGGWSSKLFQTVREKHSLCYFIGASRSISHSLLFIYASIDSKDYEETLKLIKQELHSMEKGDFTKEHMNQILELYNNSLLEIEDNQTSIMNSLIDVTLTNNDTIEERRKNIKKVTKEDIMNLAKKVKLDTIFLLKGENKWKKK